MSYTELCYDSSGNGFLKIEEENLPLIDAGTQHRSFVLATWVKSYTGTLRELSQKPGSVSLEELLKSEARTAEGLWEKSRTVVVVSKEDYFTLHGWVCGWYGRLDYVYVPPELRRKKIASALIDFVCGKDYQYARQWPFKGGPPNGKRNPYVLRGSL